MRTRRTVRNVIISLLYEGLLIVFGLIVPRLIILTYGSEVNGLTSTITHVLQILNLLQAGAVGASIYHMYKPVAEQDYHQISKIIRASKQYFYKLGFIFLGIVIILTPMMSITTEATIAMWEKIVAFIILGLNGAFYFFFTSWFDILFSSHQRRYILSFASILDKVIYYGFVFIIIYFKFHFIFLYIATLVGTCSKIICLYII